MGGYDFFEQFGGAGNRDPGGVFDVATLNGTNGADRLNGTGEADEIYGYEGNDTLDGAAGADTMYGGAGDDIYFVDNSGDTVIESAGMGRDTIYAAVSYTLANLHVEGLVLTGSAAIGATGNAADNTLTGNSGNNSLTGLAGNDHLDGREGADTLDGGDGNDIYWVDNADDIVIENSLEGGTDYVYASVSYSLVGRYVETLFLTGGTAFNATGNDLDNVLVGNGVNNVILGLGGDDILGGGPGDDVLDGGDGNDMMGGDAGNDCYYVNSAGDVIYEYAADGEDRLIASVSYVLADGVSVEAMETTDEASSEAINLTGNELGQTIIGNAGANVLDGGRGADIMSGRLGNDIYIVDSSGDRAIEDSSTGGIDLVKSSVTFGLGANVENLTLTGTSAINGTGNALANVITGNSAANVLNGGAGADFMAGGLGNDTYIVDSSGDRAREDSSTGGIDLVKSSVTFALGANVENLTLTGTSAINGTGNALANVITGNSAANVLSGGNGADTLSGGGGADWLYGGAGKDSLTGGAGTDQFCFHTPLSASNNVDQIVDFSVADDTIHLDDDVFTAVGAIGKLSANAFHTGTAARDADDRIIYDSATGKIYYDADGNGAGAQVLFAQVTAGLALTNADFLIGG